jgi:hypothetical protein
MYFEHIFTVRKLKNNVAQTSSQPMGTPSCFMKKRAFRVDFAKHIECWYVEAKYFFAVFSRFKTCIWDKGSMHIHLGPKVNFRFCCTYLVKLTRFWTSEYKLIHVVFYNECITIRYQTWWNLTFYLHTMIGQIYGRILQNVLKIKLKKRTC